MRDVRSFMAAAAIATLFTTGLPMTELLAKAGAEDVNQVVRIGQVTDISNTTITIREDTGRYTYRLSSTGRQALDTRAGSGWATGCASTLTTFGGSLIDFRKM